MKRGRQSLFIRQILWLILLAFPLSAEAGEPWVGAALGRLHPMAVHFPIALLLSALLVETHALIRRRPLAGDTALLCLCLGAAGAVAAALLGWQAALHSDYTGLAAELLENHRWLGVGTAIGSTVAAALCFATRAHTQRSLRVAYAVVLLSCSIAVSVGGHYGGMLVFGDDYLTSAVPFLRPEAISLADIGPIGPVDFVRDVEPIFEENCYTCHGPEKQRHDLRLDARHLTIKAGRSGKAVLPGDGENSTVVRRLLGVGSKKQMPQNADALSPMEIAVVKAWIDQGAEWPDSATISDASIEKHWAYVKPERPELPEVDQVGWILNPIDAFVLARLEGEGLSPSAEADRAIWLRRVTFDLIGLPPTPAEIDAFLDDASPGAYEAVIDRLLASPHYGERWAVLWLDAARYADSHGYQRDELRSAWPYRDWVIGALNAGMGFDQFTVEQIAGDLLPDATLDQRIATGFNRGAKVNQEAGADPEEFRIAQVIDRTNVTASVWLGSTIACAQCHDHKYDPFSQREYYQLFSYFNNTPVETRVVNAAGGLRVIGPSIVIDGEQGRSQRDPTTTLVMQDLPEKRGSYLLERGNFLTPGERVEPGTPGVLHPLSNDAPPNRLGLAQWLVSAENPLVARVTVNRAWAAFFGAGLVDTPGDFGAQGAPPTHADLLDWLSVEFVEQGWSMKAIHRLIATSATYRQSSLADESKREIDPYNRLYARGPRLRLSAEMIRDSALAVSGRLNAKRFGPPVYPVQPEDMWIRTKSVFSTLRYRKPNRRDRYRRAIYTVWRRTTPYPSLANFDAPDRSTICLQRERSNTPLQALTLLNDSVYVDLAASLARRILKAKDLSTLEERLTYGFRLVTARVPDPRELKILESLYLDQLERNVNDPRTARRFAADLGIRRGIDPLEWSAWFYVATTLLNLDEAITKA